MKKTLYIILSVFIVGCSSSNNLTTSTDSNFESKPTDKLDAVLWQQTSAEYDALCYQAYNLAKLRLERKASDDKKRSRRPAIILDLDETVLNNSPYNGMLVLENKKYSPETWKEWTSKRDAKLIPGVKEFIDLATSLGVQIFYISNRSEEELAVTIENLEYLNVRVNTEQVYLKNDNSDKTERRERVFGEYEVLLLIGDNLADFHDAFEGDLNISERKMAVEKFKEEFGNRFIILPNVMYGGWEKATKMNQGPDELKNNKNGKYQLIQAY